MKEIEARFRKVQQRLTTKSWFVKGGWQTTTHPFPKDKSQGITFHIFKKHWHNEDRMGIHIESYLDFRQAEQKKSYVTLHVLHHATIPGTKIKRIQITKPLVDSIEGQLKEWKEYKFRAGKYGMQPFTRGLDGTSSDFEKQLEFEVTRLAKLVGPVLDQILEKI